MGVSDECVSTGNVTMRQSNNRFNQNPLFIITQKYHILIQTEARALLNEVILVFKMFNISAQKPFQYR